MGYVNIDLWKFPEDVSDDELREQLPLGYEAGGNAEAIAIGPVLQDPTRTFTHGAVHRMDGWWDLSEEQMAAFVGSDAADAVGQWIGYRRCGKWLGLRVVDFDDPQLKQHGKAGWSKHLSEPLLELARRHPRYGEVLASLAMQVTQAGAVMPRTCEAWVRESLGVPFKDEEWS